MFDEPAVSTNRSGLQPLQVSACDFCAVVLQSICLPSPPSFNRSDNDTEFIAQALHNCCEDNKTTSTAYVVLGPSLDNGFTE